MNQKLQEAKAKINQILIEKGIYQAIDAASIIRREHSVSKPIVPKLNPKHTLDEARDYTKKLEQYEKDLAEYKLAKEEVNNFNDEIENYIVEIIKEEAGLKTVPEQYRDKVYALAYQDGHSGGYSEVYSRLNTLIGIFD